MRLAVCRRILQGNQPDKDPQRTWMASRDKVRGWNTAESELEGSEVGGIE